MDTIKITSSKGLCMSDLRLALSQHWQTEDAGPKGLVVHGASSRVYLHQEPGPLAGGGEEWLVDYSDVELVKQVLETIVDDADVVVDNDFGTALPATSSSPGSDLIDVGTGNGRLKARGSDQCQRLPIPELPWFASSQSSRVLRIGHRWQVGELLDRRRPECASSARRGSAASRARVPRAGARVRW